MRWSLILKLSLFGLAMAAATVETIPPTLEGPLWLVLFVVCAILIARAGVKRPFWHGFLTSLVNAVWITGAHILYFQDYLAHHPQEAAMAAKMPLADSPRLLMALTGPLVGVVTGVVLGLFAWVATRFMGRRK